METSFRNSNSNYLESNIEVKSVLLIDDNEATNYFNKIIIERNISAKITVMTNGLKAINYIKSLLLKKYEVPEFILLDLNMPEMDGWEFLEEYVKLTPLYKKTKIIISSNYEINESDNFRIKRLLISNYIFVEKIISKELVKKVMC